MAGRPQGRTARNETVAVRLTADGMAALDRRRGSLTRSAYVRTLISRDAAKEGVFKP